MKIHLVSLGCPKNTVDSEVMLGLLEKAGFEAVPEMESADVVLVNTCGFIEAAKRESLDALMEAVQVKEQKPGLKVVAAGCLAQRYREELTSEIPELDAVVGVDEVPRIAEILAGKQRAAADAPLFLYESATPRTRITPRHFAYLKISEGCSHGCAFCAIPSIRGPFRSRSREDLLREAETLLADGVKELILIGQDTTAWGRGSGTTGTPVAGLLKDLDRLGGEFWVRLMYTYPAEVGPDLLETLAGGTHICRYLDIPFQHAHPDVLGAMRRAGDAESYLRFLEEARAAVPGLSVRTSLITGFPGEREGHFRYLMDFVRAARFDHLGVFAYSDEEGTSAFLLPGKVRGDVAERRRGRLMSLQKRLLARQARSLLGTRTMAIVDGITEDAEYLVQARLAGQAPEIDSVLYLVDGPMEGLKPGDFVPVRLTRYLEYDFAAVVEEGDERA